MSTIDLQNMTPEDIASLRALLGVTTTGTQPYGWSPPFSKGVLESNPRQLHDLTLAPTKDDPRPTYFWSAEKPRSAPEPAPWRQLLWDGKTGEEITVHSEKARAEALAKGYVLMAPANAAAPDPKDAIRAALEALPAEDRKLLIAAAQKDRLAALQAAMAGLTDDELTALADSIGSAKKRSA